MSASIQYLKYGGTNITEARVIQNVKACIENYTPFEVNSKNMCMDLAAVEDFVVKYTFCGHTMLRKGRGNESLNFAFSILSLKYGTEDKFHSLDDYFQSKLRTIKNIYYAIDFKSSFYIKNQTLLEDSRFHDPARNRAKHLTIQYIYALKPGSGYPDKGVDGVDYRLGSVSIPEGGNVLDVVSQIYSPTATGSNTALEQDKQYTISVRNEHGWPQTYRIFSEPPVITGAPVDKVWPIIMDSTTISSGQQNTLEIGREYCAITATLTGKPIHGTSTFQGVVKPITLGNHEAGTSANGTSVHLSLGQHGQFFDLGSPTTPGKGESGCFHLSTADGWVPYQALNNCICAGVGITKEHNTRTICAFIPQSKCDYQIKPQHIFHITTANCSPGSIVDPPAIRVGTTINFQTLGRKHVTIIHDETDHYRIA